MHHYNGVLALLKKIKGDTLGSLQPLAKVKPKAHPWAAFALQENVHIFKRQYTAHRPPLLFVVEWCDVSGVIPTHAIGLEPKDASRILDLSRIPDNR